MRFRMRPIVLLLLGAGPVVAARTPVKLTKVQQGGQDVVVMENYRMRLVVAPSRGGAVVSFSDKLRPAELLLQKKFQGLCMDHFQSQSWPGEFLESPYTCRIEKTGPDAASVCVTRVTQGLWRPHKVVDKKIAGLVIAKTFTLRRESPALECEVTITTPAHASKVFAYWQQNVFFPGGQYDRAEDKGFRPSTRGVRVTSNAETGFYGREEWLRDTTAGWAGMLDTAKGTGLVTLTDYNDLQTNYINGGNRTMELMYSPTFLPKGKSRTYWTRLVPVAGIKRLMHASPHMIVGYTMASARGTGTVTFQVVRSSVAVTALRFDVSVVGAEDGKSVKAGSASFGTPGDEPVVRAVSFSGASADPLVLRVRATGAAGGKTFAQTFEDFHAGSYKWADNITTDMRTPVYKSPLPPKTLVLQRPEPLRLKDVYGLNVLYFEGLCDEYYGVARAVKSAGYRFGSKRLFYSYSGSWLGKLSDFPYDYNDLLSYDTMVLGGISHSALRAIGVEMLHDFLGAGGGMVVLGGPGAYGTSQLAGTKLAAAMPVAVSASRFDLVKVGPVEVVRGPDVAPYVEHIEFPDRSQCVYVHDVKVKPGAKVLLKVGGRPFLVTGEYGKANTRIACILGAPLGEPQVGHRAFWQSPAWHYLVRSLIWWTARQDYRF